MNRKVNAVVSAGADEVVGTMQAGVDNILDRALDYTGNVVKGHVKVRTCRLCIHSSAKPPHAHAFFVFRNRFQHRCAVSSVCVYSGSSDETDVTDVTDVWWV